MFLIKGVTGFYWNFYLSAEFKIHYLNLNLILGISQLTYFFLKDYSIHCFGVRILPSAYHFKNVFLHLASHLREVHVVHT